MAGLQVLQMVPATDTSALSQLGSALGEGFFNTEVSRALSNIDPNNPTSVSDAMKNLYNLGPRGIEMADRLSNTMQKREELQQRKSEFGQTLDFRKQVEARAADQWQKTYNFNVDKYGHEAAVQQANTAYTDAVAKMGFDIQKYNLEEQQRLANVESQRAGREESIFTGAMNRERAKTGEAPLAPITTPPPAPVPQLQFPTRQQVPIPPQLGGPRPSPAAPAPQGAMPPAAAPIAGPAAGLPAGLPAAPVPAPGPQSFAPGDFAPAPLAAAPGPGTGLAAIRAPVQVAPAEAAVGAGLPAGGISALSGAPTLLGQAGPDVVAPPAAGPTAVPVTGRVQMAPPSADTTAQQKDLQDSIINLQTAKGGVKENGPAFKMLEGLIKTKQDQLKQLQEQDKETQKSTLQRGEARTKGQLEALDKHMESVDKGMTRIEDFDTTLRSMYSIISQPGFVGGWYANWAMNGLAAAKGLNELVKATGLPALDDSQINAMARNRLLWLSEVDKLSKAAVLHQAGGSLNQGFTNQDRDFIQKQLPGITDDPEVALRVLKYHMAINERHRELNDISKQGYEADPPWTVAEIRRQQREYNKANPLFVRTNPQTGKDELTPLGATIAGKGPALRGQAPTAPTPAPAAPSIGGTMQDWMAEARKRGLIK